MKINIINIFFILPRVIIKKILSIILFKLNILIKNMRSSIIWLQTILYSIMKFFISELWSKAWISMITRYIIRHLIRIPKKRTQRRSFWINEETQLEFFLFSQLRLQQVLRTDLVERTRRISQENSDYILGRILRDLLMIFARIFGNIYN